MTWCKQPKTLLRPRAPSSAAKHNDVTPQSTTTTESVVPALPVEIWRKIVGYAVRLPGRDAVDLGDPFSPSSSAHDPTSASSPSSTSALGDSPAPAKSDHETEEDYCPELDPGVFDDRRALAQVNAVLRCLVIEASVEYIVLRSAGDIEHYLQIFEHSSRQEARVSVKGKSKKRKDPRPSRKSPSPKKGIGERTKRIDMKILGPYKPSRLALLLHHTPNLAILLLQNNRYQPELGRTPKDLLLALRAHTKGLRRLDFDSIAETPALVDIAFISQALPHLETLRLSGIHSYPPTPAAARKIPIAHFPSLRTLSLGGIPEPQVDVMPEHYAGVWDPFLRYLGFKTKQLPRLERFETGVMPVHDTTFFETHGWKIRVLRVTTWKAGRQLPFALEHCVNLEDLVLAHGGFVPVVPRGHHGLKRICVLHAVEQWTEVPSGLFKFAVLKPLEELVGRVEEMEVPQLVEVRLRNEGAYERVVEHAFLLNRWWRRFALRGIRFVDREGRRYDQVVDPNEAILDKIRE